MANEFKHASVGTSLSQSEYEAIGGHVIDSQATGDIIYASSATQLSRLGVGSNGHVLTLAGGIPSWAATAGVSAADLTGTTLASNVVSSSLTTVGTLTTLTVDNVIINDVYIGHTSDTDLMTLASGGLTVLGTITVGVDDTGHNVKFFGASAGAYFEWTEASDQLELRGASADAVTSTGKLLLTTALTDVNALDVIGKISWQAPLEAGGGDAVLVSAKIEAIAQATFSSSNNETDLIFSTGHTEAATEKFRFTSQGELGIGGANYGTSGQVLTSGGAGVAPSWATASGGGLSWADFVGI
jgi:hypothetical protein